MGSGTDLALLAGVLGLSTMDDGIPNAKKIAEKMAYNMNSRKGCSEAINPNTVLVELTGRARTVKVLASSLGGGKVVDQEFDEYPFKFSGERPTLVIRHSDQKGVIAELSDILYQKGINIASMANERSKINGAAITV